MGLLVPNLLAVGIASVDSIINTAFASYFASPAGAGVRTKGSCIAQPSTSPSAMRVSGKKVLLEKNTALYEI
jgi:hypothetical protein